MSQTLLFLKYEDLKKDPHKTVKAIGEFIGVRACENSCGKVFITEYVNKCNSKPQKERRSRYFYYISEEGDHW